MTYFFDRHENKPDGKITTIHWHVAGKRQKTQKISLVIQHVYNGYVDNSKEGIIQQIASSEMLHNRLSSAQVKKLREELADVAICHGGCS
jgi:hypothetical protein